MKRVAITVLTLGGTFSGYALSYFVYVGSQSQLKVERSISHGYALVAAMGVHEEEKLRKLCGIRNGK